MPSGVYKRTAEHIEKIRLINVGRKHTYKRSKKQHDWSVKAGKKIGKMATGDSFVKHHLYGREHKETIRVTRRIHNTIHLGAYFFVIDRYGKKGIVDYLRWLCKNRNNIKISDLINDNEG